MVKMRFALATAPATEPITTAELASQCRIGSTEATTEATYITSLCLAARVKAEELCGPIITQSWDGYLDEWPCDDTIVIPKYRVTAITSVKYTIMDASAATTLSSTTYLTDFIGDSLGRARIRLKNGQNWPSDSLEVINPIAIRFSAGYANAAAVPETLKQAMRFLASHWYNNREIITDGQVADIPNTFMDLITDHRDWGLQ